MGFVLFIFFLFCDMFGSTFSKGGKVVFKQWPQQQRQPP
jgi:hypothetical protein